MMISLAPPSQFASDATVSFYIVLFQVMINKPEQIVLNFLLHNTREKANTSVACGPISCAIE